jgi:predicted small integral membrane protein
MAGLIVIDLAAGVLLVVVGIALWRERRPDDPGYTPAHVRGHVRDELERALSDDRRALRRHPAPWAAPRPKPLTVTVTKPLQETHPMDKILERLKAVVAAVGGVATLVYLAIQDQAISFDEASGIGAALLVALTAVGVWRAPNKPPAT